MRAGESAASSSERKAAGVVSPLMTRTATVAPFGSLIEVLSAGEPSAFGFTAKASKRSSVAASVVAPVA